MRGKALTLFLLLAVIGLFFLVEPTIAQGIVGEAQDELNALVPSTGIEQDSVAGITGTIIKGALTLVGLFFFLLVLYAGLTWMLARGNDEQINNAKNTLIGAIIGLLVSVSAYGISVFLTEGLISGVNSGDPNAVGSIETQNGTQEDLYCCLLKAAPEGSQNTNQVSLGNWLYIMTTVSDCNNRKAAPGTILLEREPRADIQDAGKCQEVMDEKAYDNLFGDGSDNLD